MSFGKILLALLLVASIALNIMFLCGGLFLRTVGSGDSSESRLREHFVSGASGAADKVAIVRIEGAIIETTLGFAFRQIEEAARDSAVRAVVVRVESPGGSITASDELHRRLTELRDGTTPKFRDQSPAKKPLVVSMGSIAASGGYYIAMPAFDSADPAAKKLFAERTTITGSIGVYAAFPNVEELAKKHGVAMDMIKAGAVKGSGSLFFKMTPQERQPWADMVDQAYQQFLSVVEQGRPRLKGKLTENLFPPKSIPLHDDRGNIVKDDAGQPKTTTYTRQRADGGVFTADEALKWGLIDTVGTLEDAIAEAARQSGLASYRAVSYERPLTLLGMLTGPSEARATVISPVELSLTPRIWYLAPGAELSALMSALGH